jgi:hypothetical protein
MLVALKAPTEAFCSAAATIAPAVGIWVSEGFIAA